MPQRPDKRFFDAHRPTPTTMKRECGSAGVAAGPEPAGGCVHSKVVRAMLVVRSVVPEEMKLTGYDGRPVHYGATLRQPP